MNWLWIFLTALIIAAIATVAFCIGTVAGYSAYAKKMIDDLNELIDDYKEAVERDSKFFKDMADAINKINGNGDES